jgi:hypothetical protein
VSFETEQAQECSLGGIKRHICKCTPTVKGRAFFLYIRHMKKSRWFSPYAEKGVTNLAPVRKCAGVYIIRKKGATGRRGMLVLYVGHSQTDLYKTITRHFQKWELTRKEIKQGVNHDHVIYDQLADLEIRVVICTPAQSVKLEEALIEHYEPTDNPRKTPAKWTPAAAHYQQYENYLDADLITKKDLEDYMPF